LPDRVNGPPFHWQPAILTNNLVFMLVPILVIAGNIIMLFFGARPHTPNTIPRYWWPISFFLIEVGAFIYWCAMVITWIKVGPEKNRRTIGDIIGFKVNVYNETDMTIPETLQDDMVMARLDGSRRRVGYEVCYYQKFGSSRFSG
jgi:hypothetical protein